MTLVPVVEEVVDTLDVPVLQPHADTCLPIAAPINDEKQIPKDKSNINSLALSITPLLATWEWIKRLAIS